MNKRQEEILKRIKERDEKLIDISTLVNDFFNAIKMVVSDTIETIKKIAEKPKKTYRFEISGYCEIDVDATSMEEAEQKCEEAMKEIFDKDLFTDYRFVEEVENDSKRIN